MNVKKLLPIILLIIMAVATISIKRCNSGNSTATNDARSTTTGNTKTGTNTSTGRSQRSNTNVDTKADGLDRSATDLYFTKHAKCRMKCRHINQQEVKDILENGEINYNKSDLQDPKGPTYAVEGITKDRQRVRIIFAPKKAHLTVVTVIDLEVEYQCNCT